MGLWNAQAGAAWNRLRVGLNRMAPGIEYFRAVEPQERGALHLHLLIWSPVQLDVLAVQALAMRAGFGCVLDRQVVQNIDKAAGYVAKYVTKATDQRADLPWEVVDRETGEVVALDEAPYRTWSSSSGWGMTMRMVREAVRLYAQRRAERLAALPVMGEAAAVVEPVEVEPRPPD